MRMIFPRYSITGLVSMRSSADSLGQSPQQIRGRGRLRDEPKGCLAWCRRHTRMSSSTHVLPFSTERTCENKNTNRLVISIKPEWGLNGVDTWSVNKRSLRFDKNNSIMMKKRCKDFCSISDCLLLPREKSQLRNSQSQTLKKSMKN